VATKKKATRTVKKKAASKKSTPSAKARAGAPNKRWSAQVMKESDAMDLKRGVFTLRSAKAIASSLKKSSESSTRRKSSPFQSAMSMLNFEINRAGKNLSAARRQTLERAKDELRKQFGR
jgi:hypothetical protein